MHALLLMLLTAPPQFEVKAPTPEERARRAQIRCGGAADAVSDAGVGTFSCHDRPGVDVTDALRQADLVVRGKVTRVETDKQFADLSPEWRSATVKVLRVLRGNSKLGEVKFLFIGSTKDGHATAPKVKVGQEGVWLLTRGKGPVKDLMMLTSLDAHPASAEGFLRELISATACEKPEGSCKVESEVCPGEGVTCTCEALCPGGADLRTAPVTLRWICRPNACATAAEGMECAPEGMFCEGCWGTHPWTCEQGRWKEHYFPPPP